jgi:hypothetical protein
MYLIALMWVVFHRPLKYLTMSSYVSCSLCSEAIFMQSAIDDPSAESEYILRLFVSIVSL